MAYTSDLTAAPADVELSGKPYRMSPITEGDFGDVERWCRVRILDTARQAAEECPDEAGKRLYMDTATRQAAALHIGSDLCRQMMATPDGATRMLWLSLRHNHPDLTYRAAVELFRDADNVRRGMDRLDDLSGGPKKKEAEAPPPDPK